MNFNELKLNPAILKACRKIGYDTPTEIQQKAIPAVLQGKDLLGLAQTGTGKTAAFALPILQRLAQEDVKEGNKKIRALVLTPTRELALQIVDNFKEYGQYLPLKTAVIFGGVKQTRQVAELKKGADILVATPGRLLDLVSQRLLDLSHVNIYVLDEADRMLDMGFIRDVKKITTLLSFQRQTLLFSATMPTEIAGLAASLLKNPIRVESAPVSTPIEKIEQSVYFVEKQDKNDLLIHLIKEKAVNSALIFTRTKHEADRVVRFLGKSGVKSLAIHGNKSQNARQNALNAFKKHEIKVLVATDIAARGIDIDRLPYVINYNIPNISETYVHRIGRTARAGREGIAISLCQKDERPYLKDIEKLIRYSVPVQRTQFEKQPEQKGTDNQSRKASGSTGRAAQSKNKQKSAYRGAVPQKNQLQKGY